MRHPLLLALAAALATAHAASAVDVQLGEPEPLPELLYGFNCNLIAATAFNDITFGGAEIDRAIRELRPNSLRFPGGTPANNYLWAKDSFSEAVGDLTKWAGELIGHFRRIGKPYGLPEYARLCENRQLEPIWVLNIYEETPESVAAMLDHLDALGLELRAIEFANEPYWDPRSLNNVWKYSEFCQPLAAAIRKKAPEIKIGACFAPLRDKPTDYRTKWNAVLAKQDWYDAIVFHDYYGGQGFALEKGERVPVEAMLRPDEWLDQAFAELKELLPGKEIWFTEWNFGSEAIKQWKNKGAELLFLGAATAKIVEHRETVTRSLFHQIYEGGFGTFYFDKESGGIETTASYQFFKLLGAAFAGADKLQPASFGDGSDLLGFATLAADGKRLFVVNRSDAAKTLQLPDSFAGEIARLTIECPPEQELPTSKPLARTHAIAGRKTVLPPYSISLVAAPAALELPEAAAGVSANLFPARPHLTLWYPPYARKQPRVDAAGKYALDFSKLTDKEMAVVKMDLAGLGLEKGARYTLSLDAASPSGHGLTVKLPRSAGSGDGAWSTLGSKPRPLRFTFAYDPEVNDGEVSFFFGKDILAAGAKFELGNFAFEAAE